MTVCTVVGHVWATKKENSLSGLKLMVVREERGGRKTAPEYVAADLVGAGIGELVLITTDETTQHALDRAAPVDAYIVGIVDSPPQIGK